jgi:hypothetical protein|tara:strand:- start:418 stop:633 length:216 start_codon:yes stop_codon:yes gene_type:complete
MKLLVIMWILQLSDLSGERKIYNGTIDDCLTSAMVFNAEHTEAIAGCFVDGKSPDYEDRSQRREGSSQKEY